MLSSVKSEKKSYLESGVISGVPLGVVVTALALSKLQELSGRVCDSIGAATTTVSAPLAMIVE